MKYLKSALMIVGIVFAVIAILMLQYFVNPGYDGSFADRVNKSPMIMVLGFMLAGISVTTGFIVQKLDEKVKNTI